MPPPAPTVLDGKYDVVRQLGQGGMGTVYEARHRATGRRVAVKVIAPERLTSTPSAIQRFQREALASGAIDSQHVAQILDAGVDPASGQPYMALELLVGEDLHRALARMGRMPPSLALRIAAQACLGLKKAHEAGIVHRDIKPANLFLARRDQAVTVKLLDFGLAKVNAEQVSPESLTSHGVTVSGAILGSPAYMSPEQALGHRTLDHRSDLWSLGVVLYEMLSGRTPVGEAATAGEVILRICTLPPPPIAELAPEVSPELAAIVHRALAREPAQRFASAAEVLDALLALLPNGHAIEETMFPALPVDDRPAAGVRLPDSAIHDGSTLGFEGVQKLHADTSGGLANSPRSEATAPPARGLARAMALFTAAAVVGGVAFAFLKRAEEPPPLPPVTTNTATTPSLAAPAPPAAIPTRTVTVVVLPPTAQVTVDGARVPVGADGSITLSGPLGSTHDVVLSNGRSEQAFHGVAVTETGAQPPKLELPGEAEPPATPHGKPPPHRAPAPAATSAHVDAPAPHASASTDETPVVRDFK